MRERDPYRNLAREEVLLGSRENLVSLWQNRPSVIIGRNQDARREADYNYLEQEEIPLVRRITGGGAVYHDLGNLNYSFFFDCHGDFDKKVRQAMEWIRSFLEHLGLDAMLTGRNDICVAASDGILRKVSGCGMLQRGERGLLHGTLLFSADLEKMEKVLTPPAEKLVRHGIQSVHARVANLKGAGSRPQLWDLEAFCAELADFLKENTGLSVYLPGNQLPGAPEEKIEALTKEKYGTAGWNLGALSK